MTDDKKTRDRFLRFPIDRFEARILEAAEHHEGKKKQERRQNEFPFAELVFAFSQPEQKQSDRCNQTRRGWNGKAGKVLFVIGVDLPPGLPPRC